MRRFAVTGVISTGFAFISLPVIFWIISSIVHLYFTADENHLHNIVFNVAYCLAVFMNVTFSFVLQKKAVFKTKEHWFSEYIRFWIGALGIILIGYFLLRILMSQLSLTIIIANTIVVLFSAIASFLFHSFITFRMRLSD